MNKLHYEGPLTLMVRVEAESGFCVKSSNKETDVDNTDSKVDVDGYKEIDNEISFD